MTTQILVKHYMENHLHHLGLYFDSNLYRKYHIDYCTSLCISGAESLYISPYLHYGVWCAWGEAATTHLTMQLKTTSTSFISLSRKTLYKPANQCVSGSKRNKCSYFC